MKHYQKIKISPSLPRFINDNDYVFNLRNSTDGNTLKPVGLPTEILNGRYDPIVIFRHDDGTETLFVNVSDLLYTVNCYNNDNIPQYLCKLPGLPLCAIANNSGIIIMTRQGAFRIDFDCENQRWITLGLQPDFPAFSFRITKTAEFSQYINKRNLLGSYGTQSSALDSADLKNISADMTTAYKQISQKASDAGYFIQPILARYKLVDKNNNILFTSCPVIVGLPSGIQAIDYIEIEMPDYTTLNGYELKATGFKLSIVAPEHSLSTWNDIVEAMVIETLPMIHPVVDTAQASHRFENKEASGAIVRTYLPGVATDMTVNLQHFADDVVRLLENWENNIEKQCRIAHPLAIKPIEPFDLRLGNVTSDYIKNDIKPINSYDTFTAECAEVLADMVTWADITTKQYKGFPLDMFAIEHENTAWRGYSHVSCKDSSLVNNSQSDNLAPTMFSPLIIYPDGAAQSITLTLSKNGVVKSIKLPLTPSPSGRFAYFINPGFIPINPTQEIDAYIIPAHSATEQHYQGGIAIADADCPMNLTAFDNIAQGRIMAVTPAVRSTSAWDFARKHLYLFTDTGIYALAVNASRTALSAHIIDQRRITSPRAVTYTHDGVLAVASNDLVKVTGARAITLDNDTDFNSIAYSSRFNELWIKRDNGQLLIKDLTDGGYYFRDFTVENMIALSDRLLLTDNNGIYDASHESDAPESKVRWNKRISIDGNLFPKLCRCHDLPVLRDVMWRVFANDLNGQLAVYGDYGSACGNDNRYLLSKFIVSGPLNTPISGKIIAPQLPYISVTIEAVTDNDFVFDNIVLLFAKI